MGQDILCCFLSVYCDGEGYYSIFVHFCNDSVGTRESSFAEASFLTFGAKVWEPLQKNRDLSLKYE